MASPSPSQRESTARSNLPRMEPDAATNDSLAEEKDSSTASTPATPSTATPSIPNGGLKAWIQVAGGFCLSFNCWGLANTYGTFQTFYQNSLLSSESPSSISWIGSFQVFMLCFGGLVAGPVYDRGYLRALLGAGTFLICFGMFMTSICSKYWQFFLSQGLVVGMGYGCLFLPSISIVAQYFTTKKALAFGVASLGGSIGGVIYPLIFRSLLPQVGFGWTARAIAFIMLALQSIPLAFMSRLIPPSPHAKHRKFISFAAYRASKPLTAYAVANFFGFMGVYIAFFYIQLYSLQRTDISPTLATYLLSILNAATLFGRLASNYCADRIGPLNVQLFNSLAGAVLVFSWTAIRSEAGIVAFAVLYGFFSGSFNSLPGPTVISLSPDLGTIGVQVGIALTVSGLGSLIGNPIAGAILKSSGGWVGLQAWSGSLFLVFAGCVFVARCLAKGARIAAKA